MYNWTVRASRRVEKQVRKLPEEIRHVLFALLTDIEENGPVQGAWPNYGKLGKTRHHCHLKIGRPTYVAVWEVRDNEVRLIELTYAGTHQGAPY